METFRQENLFLAIACRLRSRSMFCSANANITAIQRQNAVSVYSKCKKILHFGFARQIIRLIKTICYRYFYVFVAPLNLECTPRFDKDISHKIY